METNVQQDIAMRVISDHIRAVVFSISDGQLPSNAKAGYVIRRILRRAKGMDTLAKFKKPFIYKLVPILESSMGGRYKELSINSKLITNVIFQEEQSFLRTLSKGLKRIDEIISKTAAVSMKDMGKVMGIPKDLTALILSENSLSFNSEEFAQEMQNQKERSKISSNSDIGDWVMVNKCQEEFNGYNFLELNTKISRYRKVHKKNKGCYYNFESNNILC